MAKNTYFTWVFLLIFLFFCDNMKTWKEFFIKTKIMAQLDQ